jgi:AcrR family transcriptional regulator
MAKKKSGLRRLPRQERGRQRIDRILDAADGLFARVGYEAATTNAIAREARTSIGSLYQFFPNKEAVLHALAARYLEKLRAVHQATLGEEAVGLPLPELYDRIIGGLAQFHADHPGFQHLFYGSTASPHLAAAAAELMQECISRVDNLMARRLPGLDPVRRRFYATMNVEVIKALLPLANTAGAADRDMMLGEVKNLLLGHMLNVMREAGAEGAED